MSERSRPSFRIPSWPVGGPIPKGKAAPKRSAWVQSDRVTAQVRREWHGANYGIQEWSDDRHAGDPQQIALREPDPYAHPQPLGDLLDPGGPRIWPVSQEIGHGAAQSRSTEFDAAMQEVADLAAHHAEIGFYDRRFEGRRHRSGYLYEERREPPPRGGWQSEVNTHERLTSF